MLTATHYYPLLLPTNYCSILLLTDNPYYFLLLTSTHCDLRIDTSTQYYYLLLWIAVRYHLNLLLTTTYCYLSLSFCCLRLCLVFVFVFDLSSSLSLPCHCLCPGPCLCLGNGCLLWSLSCPVLSCLCMWLVVGLRRFVFFVSKSLCLLVFSSSRFWFCFCFHVASYLLSVCLCFGTNRPANVWYN